MTHHSSLLPLRTVLILAGIFLAAGIAAPARPQSKGSVAGTILNGVEKPWPGLDLTFYDDKMQFETTTTTSPDGKYRVDLPAGAHVLVATIVSHGDHVQFKLTFVVFPRVQTPGDVNFKQFQSSYSDMQEHFGNGDKDLFQLKKSREQINKLQSEIDQAGDRAIEELQKALASTDDQNSFFHRSGILSKIGETYDAMGEYAAAARAYQQALALRPDPVGFANLSNDLAKSGKFDEAVAACERSAELDPSHSAHGYLDLAINFYNALRFPDAIVPATKVTELDPNNAKAWYVRAAALAATIDFRTDTQNIGKVIPTVPPGTAEAFQKVIALDPKSEWGKLAREGLDQLQQIQSGIDAPLPPKQIH